MLNCVIPANGTITFTTSRPALVKDSIDSESSRSPRPRAAHRTKRHMHDTHNRTSRRSLRGLRSRTEQVASGPTDLDGFFSDLRHSRSVQQPAHPDSLSKDVPFPGDFPSLHRSAQRYERGSPLAVLRLIEYHALDTHLPEPTTCRNPASQFHTILIGRTKPTSNEETCLSQGWALAEWRG